VRWSTRTRIFLATAAGTLLFTGYSAWLVELQIVRHEEYSQHAAAKNSIRQEIPARRGLILDRHGEPLAANIPIRTVVADGSHISNPQALAKLASPILDIPEQELAATLATDRKYLVVRKELPEQKALDLKKKMARANLRGLYFEHDAERIYPNGSMLSHTLGFVDHTNTGVQGIEKTMNDYLDGRPGFRHIERDRTGRELVIYRGQERQPLDGYDIRLTIDMGLQAIVEEELENSYDELQPRSIVCILADPKTGAILAMATNPCFDPAKIAEAEPEQMKNRAIIDMYEPGSTFKIVAMAAALEEEEVTPETQIFCENGRFHYGGKILRDHHGYGNLSVHNVMVKSSNIGSAKLAMKTGSTKYYEYIRRFGFGERTGIELPGEIPGLVHPPHRWSKLSITRLPMGHEIAVTPLQITMAMAAIANGGTLMLPQIIHEVRDSHGNVISDFQPSSVRRVISPETAKAVTNALSEVVSPGGTAPLAGVTGFSVAGKTGTAQRVDPNGGYTPGKYVVSFIGFMPAEDPAFVGLVVVDDATVTNGLNYGGLVAGPIFSRIAEKVARHLDLVPALRAMPVNASAKGGTP